MAQTVIWSKFCQRCRRQRNSWLNSRALKPSGFSGQNSSSRLLWLLTVCILSSYLYDQNSLRKKYDRHCRWLCLLSKPKHNHQHQLNILQETWSTHLDRPCLPIKVRIEILWLVWTQLWSITGKSFSEALILSSTNP